MEGSHLGCLSPKPCPPRPSPHPARPGTRRGHRSATGADLIAYNSTESAADFADLRKALGYAAWNVYGTWYGSYLAQTLMREHPEGIRSVVLDSVLPTAYTIPGYCRSVCQRKAGNLGS